MVTDSSSVTVKVNGQTASLSGNQFTADNVSLYPGTNVIKADAMDSSGNVGSGQVTVAYNSASPRALSYVYDKNGNLIQRIVGQNIENFNYDYENRVKTYAGSGSSVIYAYDGLGRRVSKSNNGTTTKYYYDSNELVLEKTGSNLVYYIHGPQVDEIISDSRGYCYHYDGLGSVSNVTDNSGVHAATYNYKAFGVIRSQSGSISSQWGFTGRQYDAESGFYYYRNRYYDPRTGRFITRDPIGTAGGVNLYAYCSNNPVNFVDPWGLCASGDPIIDDPAVWAEMNKAWGESFSQDGQRVQEQGGWITQDQNQYSVQRWSGGDSGTISIPISRPNNTVADFHTHPYGPHEIAVHSPSKGDYYNARMRTYGLSHYIKDNDGIVKYYSSSGTQDPRIGTYEEIIRR